MKTAPQADLQTASTPQPAQSLGRGTVLVTAASALFVLSGYIVNITLGRTLGPADYGLFGVVVGLMSVINAVQSASIPQAVAKATAERRQPPDEILAAGVAAQLVGGVVLGLILFLFADALATLMGDGRLATPFRVAAFVLPPFALFSLLMGFRGGQGRYARQALVLSVYSVAKAVFAIGLGALLGLVGAFVGYLLAALVAIPASGIWRLSTRKMAPLRPMLLYSLPLLAIGLLFMLHLTVDLFYVKAMLPEPETAGHYTAAQNIARVPYFLASGFAVILLPAMARWTTHKPESAQALAGDALRLGFIAIAPLAALLVGAGDEIVRLLYGAEYRPAGPVLLVLGPAVACIAMSGLLASLLSGAGRPGLAVFAAAVGVIVSAAAGVFLVPAYGGIGAGPR